MISAIGIVLAFLILCSNSTSCSALLAYYLTNARSSRLKYTVGGGHSLLKIRQSLSFSSNILQIKASRSEARCSLRAGHYVAIGRDYLAMTEEDSLSFSPNHVRHANKYSVLTRAAAQEGVHMILIGPHFGSGEEDHFSSPQC